MKVLILAGGFGTRLSEETVVKPKPMVEIGGRPILHHIMKTYSEHGFNEFVILLGYKGHIIKEYFTNFFMHQSSLTIDLKTNETTVHNSQTEDWKVTLLDTGYDTMTGGRIKRAKDFIGDEPFLCTYGDGVGDIDIKALVAAHNEGGKLLTITTVQPVGRYGIVNIEDNNDISGFIEKPKDDKVWVNAGFFVCEPAVLEYIDNDQQMFEREPMERLASIGQMKAFKHKGFWHAMDTLRDNKKLNELWADGNAPWKIWK
ncbi:glucose-1-phosphate cytidylyltransferase [Arcticibacterium luteifluviistationis]|uniref:Glucose-1-phosphate cytidylyltransferase n=1 Tax=Arcticibacterium luteifluviistationis TaxID=1784714 RepID=A0A2Z4GHB5_9BACT|nr:glucose-1-phosphate cytidylyltransferase [Arcticibacterium luteifluviistationis]AWW00647.1 glucose-1-phosphate cytidylyltransferase [Arcticibacterium luteifluviistationis]